MHDQRLAGLAHRVQHRVAIERDQRPQVDHLDRDVLPLERVRHGQRQLHGGGVRDDRQVAALTHDVGLAQRHQHAVPRAGGDLLLDAAVEELVLAEHDRIGVADRRPQHPVGIGRRRWAHDLEAGVMVEPRLHVLGVVRAAADPAAVGAAHDQRHRPPDAVVHLRGAGDQLVVRARHEVGELHLGDRPLPGHGRTHGDAHDARLGHRGVDGAQLAESLLQLLGGPERAALAADVLAHHEHPLVDLHLVVHRGPDRLEIGHLRHRCQPPRRRPDVPLRGQQTRRHRPARPPRAPRP